MFVSVVKADDSASVYFDIGPQSMDAALIEYSEQANIQLMISSDLVNNLKTLGVRGRFDPEVALTVLLADTNLTFRVVGNDAIAIIKDTSTE
jgi:iron complex outermembrane receptor protein